MATKLAHKRLTKEYQAIRKSPPPFIIARPDEKDILTWHFIIRGPPDTPYHGGEYWGQILFPQEYPFKPVDLKVSTPSGRFEVNAKLCLSYTSFHPSTWNAAWSVATILNGLLSFMVTDDITTGSIKTTLAEKKRLAVASHLYNIGQKKFRDMFPEYSGETMTDLPDMGQQPSSSTAAPADSAPNVNPPSAGPSSSSAGKLAGQTTTNGADESPGQAASTSIGGFDAGGLNAHARDAVQQAVLNKQDPIATNWLWSRWRWIFVGFVVIVLGRITSA